MSTYLVFGATGTVGRRMAERLASLKRRVRHIVFMTGGGAPPGAAPEEQPNPVARWQATVERDCVRGVFGSLTTLSAWAAEHAADFGGDQR
ncbi:hypothetical protein SMD20_44350 [Nonomuraea sp. LP-02]|uniref:hypothetical protein n=1 Tax=Nonomuraea sp. LP-02 TaxID=3097960 RepID=UPI002E3001F4|nr:hypothetical protein [Nonomuraea sp. LP-02]MED7931317.1 hypothetical protein [Nonomuraea sp. LP-02]